MKALLLLVNNFMKTQLEILTEVLEGLGDDGSISDRKSLLDKIAWEVNKYLVPSSLDLITIDQIRNLFYSLIENYIRSADHARSFLAMTINIERMSNRPVGGRWI